MGENSPLEFLPFINNFERLLSDLSVPDDLYVTLLTPYLSENADHWLIVCKVMM